MPSKYVYKKRGKKMNYTPETLERAVTSVQNGIMSDREASTAYNVPRSTIGDRICGKHELHVPHGRPAHIPKNVEDKIVSAVKMAARRGIGLSRKQILQRFNILCERLKVKSACTTFKAGKDWWHGLKSRYPDLVLRKPERLTSTLARMMKHEVMNRYFKDLGTILDGLNLTAHPESVWNCDEMAKNFEHNPGKVVGQKGESCVFRTSSKSSNITVMACVNAAGERMPPMFVVKGKTSRSLHDFNTTAAPEGSKWDYQVNGWMNDELGEKWFQQVFLEHCGPHRPQLIILDGHNSHQTLGLLLSAMENNIHILALPPHTTHYSQPLDKAVFGPLNKKYNEECSLFIQESPLHLINKWSFPSLFARAWNKSLTVSNIQSGFRACGIYPFDALVIPEKTYGPSLPTDLPVDVATDTADQEGHEEVAGTSTENIRDDNFVATPLNPPAVNILDISDPTQLVGLLNDTNVTMEPLTEVQGQEITIPLMNAEETVVASIPALPTLDQQVNDVFIPPAITSPIIRKRKQTAVKSHRLLTSVDVLNEKIRLENVKVEKDLKKQQRISKIRKIKVEKC